MVTCLSHHTCQLLAVMFKMKWSLIKSRWARYNPCNRRILSNLEERRRGIKIKFVILSKGLLPPKKIMGAWKRKRRVGSPARFVGMTTLLINSLKWMRFIGIFPSRNIPSSLFYWPIDFLLSSNKWFHQILPLCKGAWKVTLVEKINSH